VERSDDVFEVPKKVEFAEDSSEGAAYFNVVSDVAEWRIAMAGFRLEAWVKKVGKEFKRGAWFDEVTWECGSI
jgi:hypothetical protein